MKLIGFIAVTGLWSVMAFAHPVAFRDSVGIMGSHSREQSDMELNYSVRHWWALHAHSMRFHANTSEQDVWVGGANFLLHRWNTDSFQANLYLLTGVGESRLSGKRRGIVDGGLLADIENRQYYFSSYYSQLRHQGEIELQQYKIRAGMAPYIGDFKDLHTWFILEAYKKTYGDTKVQLTPFLRFFYRNVLWEVGSSLKGDLTFNYIIHI
jgi:hypothetical protein